MFVFDVLSTCPHTPKNKGRRPENPAKKEVNYVLSFSTRRFLGHFRTAGNCFDPQTISHFQGTARYPVGGTEAKRVTGDPRFKAQNEETKYVLHIIISANILHFYYNYIHNKIYPVVISTCVLGDFISWIIFLDSPTFQKKNTN